jgi:hypothetical protein
MVIEHDWLKEIVNNMLIEYDRLKILVGRGGNKGYLIKAEQV